MFVSVGEERLHVQTDRQTIRQTDRQTEEWTTGDQKISQCRMDIKIIPKGVSMYFAEVSDRSACGPLVIIISPFQAPSLLILHRLKQTGKNIKVNSFLFRQSQIVTNCYHNLTPYKFIYDI